MLRQVMHPGFLFLLSHNYSVSVCLMAGGLQESTLATIAICPTIMQASLALTNYQNWPEFIKLTGCNGLFFEGAGT